jgi:hypothetical protein
LYWAECRFGISEDCLWVEWNFLILNGWIIIESLVFKHTWGQLTKPTACLGQGHCDLWALDPLKPIEAFVEELVGISSSVHRHVHLEVHSFVTYLDKVRNWVNGALCYCVCTKVIVGTNSILFPISTGAGQELSVIINSDYILEIIPVVENDRLKSYCFVYFIGKLSSDTSFCGQSTVILITLSINYYCSVIILNYVAVKI